VLLLCSGCAADLPRDQHGTTDRVRRSGVLHVGVPGPGETVRGVEDREKRLVERVAQRLGVRVEWRRGNVHTLLEDLEEVRLPLVAAALPSDSPFAARIGLSRPYLKNGPRRKDYCLAVAPGENRLLLLVDQVIADAQRDGDKDAGRPDG
jgi:hypothetical protein